jgi:hypothetical protein
LQQCAATQLGLAARGIVPEDGRRPGVGPGKAKQDAYGGGFAGAVWSEQRNELAGLDGEVEAAQRDYGAELLGDVFQFRNWH